ncbi:phosphatidate cytidylyltransferase [Pelomyxa schiedti]|nr:phosphatidate cytidylyltransferase [Pelomyxa schiedti]
MSDGVIVQRKKSKNTSSSSPTTSKSTATTSSTSPAAAPAPAAGSRWRTWWVRTAATLVMLGVFFLVIYVGHFARIIIWYVFFVAQYFLLGLVLKSYFEEQLVVYPVINILSHHHNIICFSLYLVAFVSFVMSLEAKKYKAQFVQYGWSHLVVLAILIQANFWVYNVFQGLIWLILPASLIICNDIWAFITGFFFGHTPLIQLSPKKTWEGFIGGFVATVILGYILSALFIHPWMICPKTDLFTWSVQCEMSPIFSLHHYALPAFLIKAFSFVGLNWTHLVCYPFQLHTFLMAIFGSLVAPYGGFFASGFKRAFKIKDFDEKIPGHGGVTDRMDCMFLMGTFSYLYLTTFILTPDTVMTVFSKAMALGDVEQVQLYEKLHGLLVTKGLLA